MFFLIMYTFWRYDLRVNEIWNYSCQNETCMTPNLHLFFHRLHDHNSFFFLLFFVDNSTMVIRVWEDLKSIRWRDRGDWWYLIAKWWKQLLWYSHWLSMTNYVYNWSDQLVWCHDHKNRHLRVWSNFWKHFQLQILIGCWEPIRWTLVCPYFSPYGE